MDPADAGDDAGGGELMKFLASTKSNTRFESRVPAHLAGVVTDSPWLYSGTVGDFGGNPWAWLPFARFGDPEKAWKDAATDARAKGFTELVIDAEDFRNALDRPSNVARLAVESVAQIAAWVREAVPDARIGFHGMCPLWSAGHLENTEESVDRYEGRLATERSRLSPDFLCLEFYEYGSDWHRDLREQLYFAGQFYPGVPIRGVISPENLATGQYVGDAVFGGMIRRLKKLRITPEVFVGTTSPEIMAKAWPVIAAEAAGRDTVPGGAN
jgi:hypothetical protein